MKTSILLSGLLAVGVIVAGVSVSGLLTEPSTEFLAEQGLEESALAVGSADARLMDQLSARLGLKEPRDPEIDLRAPSESDIRFLIDTFRGSDPAARMSAARALVAIQEPRAVGLLARASGSPEELAFFCAGAQEILRFKTRELAGELMIDLLEDKERPVAEGCRAELRQKLGFIAGETQDVLPGYLSSESAWVRRYALSRLLPSGDAEVRDAVAALQKDADPVVGQLATKWLAQPIPAGTDTQDSEPVAAPLVSTLNENP